MLLNDNNNLIKKVTFFYDSKNTNMAGPPSSQSELSETELWAYLILLIRCHFVCYVLQYCMLQLDNQSVLSLHMTVIVRIAKIDHKSWQ